MKCDTVKLFFLEIDRFDEDGHHARRGDPRL